MGTTNKIISIGYTGSKRCYLNISEDEAKRRYCISENMSEEVFDNVMIDGYFTVTEFDEEFSAYDIWE